MAAVADAPRELRVEQTDAGRRLDLFLAEKLRLSRAQARRLLARGVVRVDGRPVSEAAKGRALPAGAQVAVERFSRPGQERAPAEPESPLDVLASGPGWLAVDKPAGVPVHPLREDERGTLLGRALARHPEIHGIGEGGLRSGVVHRLDVDTSGVLLLASDPAAWQRLRRGFSQHRVEKVYRALVAGVVDEPGSAELGLAMARHRPARVRVLEGAERARARGAWSCVMSWQPLEAFAGATLLEVRPVTGFLHQIRAVMAWHGFPLLGDRVYAPPGVARLAPRHMLHAARVAFEEVEAAAPDAADFAGLLAEFRSFAAG